MSTCWSMPKPSARSSATGSFGSRRWVRRRRPPGTRSGSAGLAGGEVRMALAGPRHEQEQQPRVAGRRDLPPLMRVETGDEADPAGHGLLVLEHLDLAVEHHHPSALVRLVLLEALTRRKVDRHRTPDPVLAVEDQWVMGLDGIVREVPLLHAANRSAMTA